MFADKTLKELRSMTGLTQEKFADKFVIPRRTYQNWEYNETKANSQARKPPVYIKYMIRTILSYEAAENGGKIDEEK